MAMLATGCPRLEIASVSNYLLLMELLICILIVIQRYALFIFQLPLPGWFWRSSMWGQHQRLWKPQMLQRRYLRGPNQLIQVPASNVVALVLSHIINCFTLLFPYHFTANILFPLQVLLSSRIHWWILLGTNHFLHKGVQSVQEQRHLCGQDNRLRVPVCLGLDWCQLHRKHRRLRETFVPGKNILASSSWKMTFIQSYWHDYAFPQRRSLLKTVLNFEFWANIFCSCDII